MQAFLPPPARRAGAGQVGYIARHMLAGATHLAAVRRWLARALLALGWLACRLPLRWQFALGAATGRLAWRIGGRRRRIAEANVAICFPELDAAARAALVRRTFAGIGIALLEAAWAWTRPLDALVARCRIEGLDELLEAQAEGRGVLLAGAHFLTMEIAGALLAKQAGFAVVYRRNRNPVVERAMVRGRQRHYAAVIERSRILSASRRLQRGETLWYAADHDYGRRHSVFAPFFGHPAATVVAARLARLNGSAVVLFSHFRDERRQTWTLRLQRLRAYPSGEDEADAARLNRAIEAEVRRSPEQYLWLHRRFKTQPGDGAIYGVDQGRRRRRAGR